MNMEHVRTNHKLRGIVRFVNSQSGVFVNMAS